MKVTLFTPTRLRPHSFSLLETYVRNQTVQPDKWIVCIDKGWRDYKFTMGQELMCRWSEIDKPNQHSLCLNWRFAMERLAEFDAVIIAEDDDVIFPPYIETMRQALEQAELVGNAPARYINLTYREQKDYGNKDYCSLAQTAFRASVLPLVDEIASRGDPFIDIALWSEWTGSRLIVPNDGLHCGIKGSWLDCELQEGVEGIGLGHKYRMGQPLTRETFNDWLGQYRENYR